MHNYLFASKKNSKILANYLDFFNGIFRPNISTLGYFRYLPNGKFLIFDSSIELLELFFDMKGISDDPVHSKYEHFNSGSAFISADTSNVLSNDKHHNFRIALEKNLNLQQSFAFFTKGQNFYETLVFGFSKTKFSILEHQNLILKDCLDKHTEIRCCFEKFKESLHHTIRDTESYNLDLKSLKQDYHLQQHIINNDKTTIREGLMKSGILEKKDIGLENIKFTEKERLIMEKSLNGFTADSISKDICLSKRTVEFHLENIKQKLGVKKKSEMIALINKMNLLGIL